MYISMHLHYFHKYFYTRRISVHLQMLCYKDLAPYKYCFVPVMRGCKIGVRCCAALKNVEATRLLISVVLLYR